jgi:cysteinyl-tRNA synthetase
MTSAGIPYYNFMLKLYNSLTLKKENFEPLKDKKVGLYTCGPTVYDYAHIGNLRSFVFADILQRALKYNDFRVIWIMNITDVDDKTIKNSGAQYPDIPQKEALLKFTGGYEKIFWQDLKKLNIEKPDKTPRATEFIPQMQELITKIVDAGYGYEKDGSFYFDVAKYAKKSKSKYGQLIRLDTKRLRAGTRMLSDEYEKEDLQDFVLWKAAKKDEPSWDFNYQGKNYRGRPGWHIECSAMSKEYLGIPLDIHTGGVDLKFPHHENEIAQSVAGYGVKKPVNFFLHNEHVLVDGQKMSKSLKNFYTLKDLEEKNFSPLAYRYFVLNSHYRSKLNFTWQGLEAAQNALNNLYSEYRTLFHEIVSRETHEIRSRGIIKERKYYRQKFLSAINDDLNTPQALAVMWDLIKDNSLPTKDKKNLLLDFDRVFGLGLSKIKPVEIPEKIKKLAEQREKFRQEKKWQEADEVRKKIEALGYKIEDTDKKPEIKRV